MAIKKCAACISALCLTLCFPACNVRYYPDFESRFAFHDVFHFLNPADLSPPLGDSYSFIVVSDTHISDEKAAAQFAELRSALNGASFAVVTGDVTENGSDGEIALFIQAAKFFGVPVYPLIGNHDIYTGRGEPWQRLIGSSIYRVDSSLGGTTLFMLDNANAAFGRDQLDWLAGETQSAAKRTFFFWHDNFFVNRSPPELEQTTDIRERALVMSLISKAGGDLAFMGHLHKRIIREAGGVTYIMLEDFKSTKTFCRVTVKPDEIHYSFETLQ